ncbi:hypothetical protein BDC45DRAFT_524356 [Circinella umbellata]|nr:hypothetical protein BDC45DRAFT_524356 [Circinella umbellata]
MDRLMSLAVPFSYYPFLLATLYLSNPPSLQYFELHDPLIFGTELRNSSKHLNKLEQLKYISNLQVGRINMDDGYYYPNNL